MAWKGENPRKEPAPRWLKRPRGSNVSLRGLKPRSPVGCPGDATSFQRHGGRASFDEIEAAAQGENSLDGNEILHVVEARNKASKTGFGVNHREAEKA